MFRDRLRASVGHVGQALREPEAFALRWHEDGRPYEWWVFAALALTAIAGTTTYGLTMGILEGPRRLFWCAFALTAAAGIGWSLPLPALYILNSLSGSRLRATTTFLAALVTTSWGGLALMASVPINWFFSIAVPTLPADLVGPTAVRWIVATVNVAVFLGVGVSMSDVFCRVV